MVQLFVDGGGFMWPILFIFIIGFVFVGERLYHLVKGLASDEEFAVNVSNALSTSGVDAAKNLCSESVGPVANLCGAALEKANDGEEAMEKALDQSGAIEMASMEKNMTWISLCIATAPMLGFLGTIAGMIVAFADIALAVRASPAKVEPNNLRMTMSPSPKAVTLPSPSTSRLNVEMPFNVVVSPRKSYPVAVSELE